jgi:sugar phosphate isomerase/epimerase
LLPYVDQKVKEYDIKVAIHNHGPGDKNYPSPESIIEKIKHLDKRIGLCMDIGHTMRMGEEPAAEAKKYFDRLLDVHMKDVDKPVKDGKTVVVGRGVIDIPAFLKVLAQKQYQGVVSFEYEADGKDPLPGLEQSVGYVRGVLAVIE